MRNAANKIKRPAIDEGMGKEHKKPHEVSLVMAPLCGKVKKRAQSCVHENLRDLRLRAELSRLEALGDASEAAAVLLPLPLDPAAR